MQYVGTKNLLIMNLFRDTSSSSDKIECRNTIEAQSQTIHACC